VTANRRRLENTAGNADDLKADRRSNMKRKLFLARGAGVLLFLGTVFAAAGCDTGGSTPLFTWTFENHSSDSVTVKVNPAGIIKITVSSGAIRTAKLPTAISWDYEPEDKVDFFEPDNRRVIFYDKGSYYF
jgi:hypothetical protein